jgi:hypothetical protein
MKPEVTLLLPILLLAACSQEVMRQGPQESQTYIITEPANVVQVAVVEDNDRYDSAEAWAQWQKEKESQDRYDTMRSIYSNENKDTFAEEEEDRIDRYCEERGFSACRRIDITCEKEGCHQVTVLCDDEDFRLGVDDDSECRNYEVIVEEEIDEQLTNEVSG